MLDNLINNFDVGYVIVFLMALAITLVTGPVFIPWLRKLKFGQQILEEGPSWHQKNRWVHWNARQRKPRFI